MGFFVLEFEMGITVKMESGNMKFLPLVVIHILDQLKILPKEKLNKLKKYCPLDVKNCRNKIVGKFVLVCFRF